jgi:hypothetical protein
MHGVDDEIVSSVSSNHGEEQPYYHYSVESLNDAIVSANGSIHEEEVQHQQSVQPSEDTDPIPNPPNQAISVLITRRFGITRSKLKFS